MLFVIKRVRCETAAEAEVARSEVALLSSLAHPQVLGYIDSFTHKAHLCIVTEFCSGGDLNVRLRSLKPDQHLGEETVLDWLLQITQALAHLHSQGVLHRDLKTQNIFLTCAEGGRLRLGDFGIARTLRAGGEEMAETYVGTPFFMSPGALPPFLFWIFPNTLTHCSLSFRTDGQSAVRPRHRHVVPRLCAAGAVLSLIHI